MKPGVFCGAAAIIAVAALAATTADAHPDRPFDAFRHPPMQPYRNHDGSFMRLRGTITTSSWSGYAVTAAAPYANASATWQVPNVTYDGGQIPYGYEYVFNWVGIGGYSDATLIQLGTESVVSTAGVTSFYTWYELYPAVSQNVGLTVEPGDIVTASLQCSAACSPSQTQTWRLSEQSKIGHRPNHRMKFPAPPDRAAVSFLRRAWLQRPSPA